jgi:hypothetical protein
METDMDVTAMVPGLTIEAEGVGNSKGQLDARKISFSPDEFAIEVAQEQRILANKAAAQNAQSAANQGISKASEAESSATMAQDSANQASRDAQAAGALGSADAAALSDSVSWALPRQTASESKNFPVSIKIGNEKS